MAKGAAAVLALLMVGGCSSHHGNPAFAYEGSEYSGPRSVHSGDLHGPGLEILDPWLRETLEGRTIVTLGFRDSALGFVSEEIAHRANIWFRHYADENRDMKITDPEIRTALVAAAGRHLR